MTDTQLGALIIAGAFVGAVFAYNQWQEYRYKKQANKAFARNQDDVLINTPKNVVRQGESQRLEPVLDTPARVAEPVTEPPSTEYDVPELNTEAPAKARYDDDMPDDIPDLPPGYRPQYLQQEQYRAKPEGYTPVIQPVEEAQDRQFAPEPVLVASRPEPVQPVAASYSAPAAPSYTAPAAAPVLNLSALDEADDGMLVTSLIDPAVDFIAEIHAGTAIAASEVPPFPANKRVQVIGLNQLDQWEVVTSTSRNRYLELRAGLQMADRQGPITQETLNAFCMGVQQFADEHEAVVTFPQRSAKLGAARDLDEFCASVDVLIGLNLPAGQRPIPMEKVRIHAENAGLVRANDGTFQYRSDSGKTLFVLANQDQTPLMATSMGLSLLFDVPRVAGGIAVFDYLTEFAQSLSQALNLPLVDDNGKVLNPQSLANIRRQLAELYASMDDRGIAPGSVVALRLFA
ncbi:cell division protein ZipA C-terminal FtsZ-binding domain-containing protein [Chitinibacter tainanensis]|uniref:cell division protein ZipA C-terminal FtsZ-binding domain-containing protein n=1 Tax=Chitinibacter tainanensis TaxID=230667 RepID=UPI002356D40B|nr:cell division protein ZipA C-terminal FtsZ-binding domain-containing protein [Chitinibacter tainanensis]